MSEGIWRPDDRSVSIYAKGTRVRFKRSVRTSKPLPNGEMGEATIAIGEEGTITSIFPYRVIRMDDGREIKLHRTVALCEELDIVQGTLALRVVK